MERVGTVKAVYRYPVKSLGGERLPAATLRWPGIDGDRQYAFYRLADRSRFPWFTGREFAELVTYSARYADSGNPRQSPVRVAAGDQEWDVGDPALCERLSRAAGEAIGLIQIGRGIFDSMPVSVLSTATLALVAARCGRPVDARRFRANILVETAEGQGARETDWLGGTLAFGDAPDATRLRANVAIDRCVMITIDPESGVKDPGIMRRVVEDFGNEIGVRCTTDAIGTISVGDPVCLLRAR